MNGKFFNTLTRVWRQSTSVLNKLDVTTTTSSKTYKIEDKIFHRLRYLLANLPIAMESNNDENRTQSRHIPPPGVKGMTELKRESFFKRVMIPGIIISKKEINKTKNVWKALLLRRRGVKQVAELGDKDPRNSSHSIILLDPDILEAKSFSDEERKQLDLGPGKLREFEVNFTYENWSVPEIMRAVLPSDAENVSSFTQIGHIAHLNLREESMPFKSVIGQVILEKISTVKTVVNKLNTIDNTFRNFQMELLAGENNYITELKEHGCTFKLDFSKVYWNSRLSNEHHKIVKSVDKNSIVYDVFAGIGPFAIPLARSRCCTVYANDLNPSSYEFLGKNVTLNKIKLGHVETYNLDGRDFIKTIVKENITKLIVQKVEHRKDAGNSEEKPENEMESGDKASDNKLHLIPDSNLSQEDKEEDVAVFETVSEAKTYVIMNLPGLAVEFLDAFNSLLQDLPSHVTENYNHLASVLPTVYCYTFEQRCDDMELVLRKRAEAAMGMKLPGAFNVRWVRNVAPKKEMMCLSFKLWPELVVGVTKSEDVEEPNEKRQKLSS